MSQPIVLCIAGSDSGGAAGIQADLKTLAACGAHGLSAITAVTAQNLHTVARVHVLPAEMIVAQLDAVYADFPIAAVKIGMLGNAANIRLVAGWLEQHRVRNIVVDPVLVSTSGHRLLTASGRSELSRRLLPLADVLTPNVPEAETLLQRKILSERDMREAARDLLKFGTRAVLLKGGHFSTVSSSGRGPDLQVRDYYVDNHSEAQFSHKRRNYEARGTGCTLASAIAAGLAQAMPPLESVRRAERYVQNCIRRAFSVGENAKRILGHLPPR